MKVKFLVKTIIELHVKHLHLLCSAIFRLTDEAELDRKRKFGNKKAIIRKSASDDDDGSRFQKKSIKAPLQICFLD